MSDLLPKSIRHAIVTYLIKEYTGQSKEPLGRTILQKLCYFAKAKGAPLSFSFQIYHYGPFSQGVFNVVDNLLIDDVIEDDSDEQQNRSNYKPGLETESLLEKFADQLRDIKPSLDSVVNTFKELGPPEMELVSTIHYVATSTQEWFKEPQPKDRVVETVVEIKGEKFPRAQVSQVYDVILKAGLLE